VTRRRIVLGVLAVPVLAALGWVALNWAALSTFPRMPSAYEAKEFCSCRFVEGRDDTFCDHYVHQTVVPSQGRVVDEAHKRVTARALWIRTTARWVSPEGGCVLE
jgi:hypothetical protein